jgi:hypothetical protein
MAELSATSTRILVFRIFASFDIEFSQIIGQPPPTRGNPSGFVTKEGKPYRFHLDDTLQLFSPIPFSQMK